MECWCRAIRRVAVLPPARGTVPLANTRKRRACSLAGEEISGSGWLSGRSPSSRRQVPVARQRQRLPSPPVRLHLHRRRTKSASAPPRRRLNGCSSLDGVPLDVDVTLAGDRRGSPRASTIVMDARLRRQQDQLRDDQARPARRLNEAGNGSMIYRRGATTTSSPAAATRSSTTRRAVSAEAPVEVAPAAITPRGLRARLSSAWPTAATRRATPSTCSGLPGRRGCDQAAGRSASPGSPMAAARAWSLAFLRDKIRNAERQARVPWRSPGGKKMRIAAAYLRVGPVVGPGRGAGPQRRLPRHRKWPRRPEPGAVRGCRSQSYLNGLYLTGFLNGYYCGGAPALTPCTGPRRQHHPKTSPTSRRAQPISAAAESGAGKRLPQQRRLS